MFGKKCANPWSAQAIIERIDREKHQATDTRCPTTETTAVGYSVRGLWSCHTDPGTLTAAQAHIAMQLHLECGVSTCRVRWRARTALVAAGSMVLDPRAARVPAAPHRSLFMLLRIAVFGCSTMFYGGRHALR
ncbi:hypothetical protein HLB23_15755 [Nocardia uniformis]|uniref:Uncharacterized protein n=1 Tax=Nocardia uniformis TaxID=53432 RepID=A0A849C8W4_9NOCA|nr:hypothetical protein [Nocardia uniformis]NNH71299.1 hypothetical protein [Nocardia uniformis]